MSGYDRTPDRDDTAVVGARIGARITDTLIVLVFMFALSVPLGDAAGGSRSYGDLLFLVVAFVYSFLLEGLWDGRTLGKRLFQIKVVTVDGDACDLTSSLVRNVLRVVDAILYYLVGFVSMARTDKRQRLGDIVASTVVVRDQ
ncbi:RDD family protein [Haloferax larsenii]|uniref:RDD family protein n=1 Tax=Haloferax larsenii TaxID=302484 RepID=A0ABY5R9L9_HALLR|nr:RDD family protein [Haloferax larsenii]UVE49021.1 RDD family protein [Haloferax larsenii]